MSGLDRARWLVVGPHFDRALEMGEPERALWLGRLRADDPPLAADLDELLAAHSALDRERFLEDAPARPVAATLAGQAFGTYTLVSPLGQGGMGSVWLARRSDGRFEGRAAVKLLNASLVGRAGEERFRREGSILARLTHPGIARLIDAGVSPSGQPYLVLEHVEGMNIDVFAIREDLDVAGRVRLIRDVAAAVAHAHTHLIVHRDLKPSNVLVDGEGRVKLLDFGIAKLIEDETGSAPATALTRDGGRVLTPEFAAPEQVTGEAVTTATDVYGLGVLLYLLLTGRNPSQEFLGSPADLFRSIVDDEPQRPSDVAPTDGVRRQLRGDLDTIVARALKKRPEERYASVTALDDDLRRYLDHEPIAARPDSLPYRARKFVRRNRLAVSLAGLSAVALAAGVAGTLTQARRATRHAAAAEAESRRADGQARAAGEQRDFALRQLSRAEAINDLNAFVLSDAAPSGRPFTARELLERAEQVATRQEADTLENRTEMLIAIGSLYGLRDEEGKARDVLGRAYALSRETADPSIRAKAGAALAGEIAAAGEFEKAETMIREALAELGDDPRFAVVRVTCLLRGSYVANEAGDSPLAIERAQAAQRLLAESGQSTATLDLRVSMDLAEAYRMAGRNREAAAAFEATYGRLVALGRDQTERAGTILNNWGLATHLLGRPREAESLFRRAIAIGSADGTEKNVSPMLLNNLARVLLELQRLSDAARYADLAYAEAVRQHDEIVTNQALSVRFALAIERGELDRAAAVIAELEPRWRRMMPPEHIAFAILPLYRAVLASRRGDHAGAVEQADAGIALAEANAQGLDYLPVLLLRRAEIQLAASRPDAAAADARRVIGMEEKAVTPGAFSSAIGRAYLVLARALAAEGRLEEARAAFASALQNLEPTLGADHPKTREARLASVGTASATPDPSGR